MVILNIENRAISIILIRIEKGSEKMKFIAVEVFVYLSICFDLITVPNSFV